MHLHDSPRWAGSTRSLLGLAACLVLVTGCTSLAPIQTPKADRRFPLSSVADKGKAPCTPPANATTRGECEPLEDDIDAFHGGLGRALWETDVRRRELIGNAVERTTINSVYNAMLWPLGAYFIQKKIRHPNWSALDVAAVATASYGFLNSGIADRDQLYMKTAARMACSMALFDADLYLKTEIKPERFSSRDQETDWRPRDAGDPAWLRHQVVNDTLVERLDGLSLATQSFATQREDVLVNLKLAKQAAAPSGLTPADKARLTAKGLTSSPKAQKDPSKDFIFETDSLLTKAREQLNAGLKLKQQLDDAGPRLRRQRIAIEAGLTQGLSERSVLQQPTAVATQIAQAFEAGMASERKFIERVNKQSGTARSEDWLPTPANLADLDEASRNLMKNFWTVERAMLKRTMASLADWTARHDERQRQAKADATSLGCSDGDLAEFARSLSKAAEGVGAGTPKPPKPETTP